MPGFLSIAIIGRPDLLRPYPLIHSEVMCQATDTDESVGEPSVAIRILEV